MAFMIECNFDRITSYNEAVRSWTEAKPSRENNSLRLLAGARKKHMTIERPDEFCVQLMLYGTPVVSWYADNSFELRVYDSPSIVRFANHCLPTNVIVGRHQRRIVVICGNHIYRYKNGVRLRCLDQNHWHPDHIEPWVIPRVNRAKAAKAFHELRYADFKLWLLGYMQMSTLPGCPLAAINFPTIIDMLRDRGKWRELAAHLGAGSSLDQALLRVRDAIYQACSCVENETLQYLPTPDSKR